MTVMSSVPALFDRLVILWESAEPARSASVMLRLERLARVGARTSVDAKMRPFRAELPSTTRSVRERRDAVGLAGRLPVPPVARVAENGDDDVVAAALDSRCGGEGQLTGGRCRRRRGGKRRRA